MKLYSLGYGGKACYFDLSSDGEPRYLASSSTNSNEDEDGSCWLGFGFEKGTDIYVAHEQTKLPGGEITSGLGHWRWDMDWDAKSEERKRCTSPITRQEVNYSRTKVAQCHLVLHEGYLHVANYLVGCYCIWRVNPRTGAITEKVFEDKHGKGTGKVASRQVDAHAHGVYIHNNYSYVPDLGADKIWIYKLSDDPLDIKRIGDAKVEKGYGPRHMAIDEKRWLAFLLCELEPFVYTFKIDRETGKLRELFKTATLDKKTEFLGKPFERHSVFEPLDHGAEIQLHPNKRWLYTSHRNKGSIVAFEVDELGCLERFQVVWLDSINPRHFTIEPTKGEDLYVGLLDSDMIEHYKIDQATGKLSLKSRCKSPNRPGYIGFLNK